MRTPEWIALNAGLTALLKKHGISKLLWELEDIVFEESRAIQARRKTEGMPRGAYSRNILANQIREVRTFVEFAKIK